MLAFDFESNRKAGFDPDIIIAGSEKKVPWICTNCPTGQPHMVVAVQSAELSMTVVALAVPAKKLAFATLSHCSHYTLQ